MSSAVTIDFSATSSLLHVPYLAPDDSVDCWTGQSTYDMSRLWVSREHWVRNHGANEHSGRLSGSVKKNSRRLLDSGALGYHRPHSRLFDLFRNKSARLGAYISMAQGPARGESTFRLELSFTLTVRPWSNGGELKSLGCLTNPAWGLWHLELWHLVTPAQKF